jgi:hypothetical protein
MISPANDGDSEAEVIPAPPQDRASPDGIVWFATHVLGMFMPPYFEAILRDFVEAEEDGVAVRAPHGIGKTAVSAAVVLWAFWAFDCDIKIVTTASAWRQLEKFTWPEIRLWASRANWELVGMTMRRGREILERQIKVGDHQQAFAAASDDPAKIEGAHASVVIYIFDEAKAIPDVTFDAAEGAFSAAGSDTDSRAYKLVTSTPGKPSGRFYDIHSKKPGYEHWRTHHVTLAQAVEAGRISAEWAEKRRLQWGEESEAYQTRVLGEFYAGSDELVVPLAWVELANERWRVIMEARQAGEEIEEDEIDAQDIIEEDAPQEEPLTTYGLDPAYKGEDKTALLCMVGTVVEWIRTWAKQEPMAAAGVVSSLIDTKSVCAVDVIGIGAGVYSRLRELGHRNVYPCNVSKSTKMRDVTRQFQFLNLRAAIWWMIREALDPSGDDPIALPPDPQLTGDLTAPTWWHRSDGKIQIESKDEMRKRLGRSPDTGDALGLALYARRRRKVRII